MSSDKASARELENDTQKDKPGHKPGQPLANQASGPDAAAHGRSGYIRLPLPAHMPDAYSKPNNHGASPPEKPTPLAPAHDRGSLKAVDIVHSASSWVTGFGDKEAVYKALAGKSEAQVRDMKALYQEKFKTSLRDGIKADINVPFVGDYLGSMEKADAMLNHKDIVNLPAERAHLQNSAKARLQPGEQKDLQDNIAKLEARRGVNKISDEEVARTYREVSKLLDAKGNRPLNDDERKKLALEVMHNAGTPTSIYQGKNNTCSINSVETASYMNAPSEAARVVADIALTGKYIDRNGITVENNPEPRTAEALRYPMTGGGRTHASELFQITAVNLMYKQEGIQKRYDQILLPPGHAANDTGERLYDTSKRPPQMFEQADGTPVTAPGVGPQQFGMLHHLTNTITGQDRVSAAVASAWLNGKHDDRVQSIASEQQLNQSLAQAKKDGKLPMLIHIDTDVEPFFTNSNSPRGGAMHVLTVTDFTPSGHGKPAQINADSNWGENTNYIGARKMDLHDLYVAMQPPDTAPALIKTELETERKQGKFDIVKESELLRLKSEHQKFGGAEYEREFSTVEDFAVKHLRDEEIAEVPKNHVPGFVAAPADLNAIRSNLIGASSELPVNLQLKSLDTLKTNQVLDDGGYNWNVARVWSAELNRLKSQPARIDIATHRQNAQDIAAFQNYVSSLPKNEQDRLKEQAKKFGVHLP